MSNAQVEDLIGLLEEQQKRIDSGSNLSGSLAREVTNMIEEIAATQKEWTMTMTRLERLINLFPWRLSIILSLAIGLAVGGLGLGFYLHVNTERIDFTQYKNLALTLDEHFVTRLYDGLTPDQRQDIDDLYVLQKAEPPSKRRKTNGSVPGKNN